MFLIALALAGSTAAFGQQGAACADEAAMRGMRERMLALNNQMDRIERIEDRAEQRHILDLHMKQMRESMREIRRRDLGPECRMEVMGDMMEVMIRHQHAMHEPSERH
jgi:hypothetical protein